MRRSSRFPEKYVSSSDRGLSVGVSASTATVATTCGIERCSVTSGKFLGRFKAVSDDGRCGDQATTGTLATTAGREGLTAYDVETGKKRRNRPGGDASAAQVYSADPLVMDVALDGIRGVRQVDPATGAFGPLIGRPLAPR